MALYRKNKYNESIEVYKYECGSCENYEFEREDRENYCKHYGKYYSDRDRCRGYWTEFNQGSTGCFLTTACCQYKGLPDDCYELQTMRSFRDNVLMITDEGRCLVAEYYKVAPKIVEKINMRPDKDALLEEIYIQIKGVIQKIEEKQTDDAIFVYTNMVQQLIKIFV